MLKKIMLAGVSSLFALNAFAADLVFGTAEVPLIWQPIISVSGGPAWSSPGQNQYLYPYLPSRQFNYFIANTNRQTLISGELAFGLQRIVFPGATGELGLAIAGTSDAELEGSVTVNGIPNFSFYHYKVNHSRLNLKGKLLANSYWLQPYISGGLGAGWNNSHDYRATTINPLIYPNPWFASKTNIAFAYTLGIGVQAPINRFWQVGVGYEFADWGKSGLGTDLYTNILGPAMTHMYTNEILFNISYLI